METLGERIRQAAEEIGGPKQLAERIGIPRRTLGDWISGASEPKASQIVRIAEETGVDLGWLLLARGDMVLGDLSGTPADDTKPANPALTNGQTNSGPTDIDPTGAIAPDVLLDIEQAIHNAYAKIRGAAISRQDALRLAITWYNELLLDGADVTNGRDVVIRIYDKRQALEDDLIARASGRTGSSKHQA